MREKHVSIQVKETKKSPFLLFTAEFFRFDKMKNKSRLSHKLRVNNKKKIPSNEYFVIQAQNFVSGRYAQDSCKWCYSS